MSLPPAPSASVIIPAHNPGRLLREQLDALAAQREPASQEALLAAVDRVTADLNDVNAKHDDAVLETEEREILVPLLVRAAHAAGLDEEHDDLPERDF